MLKYLPNFVDAYFNHKIWEYKESAIESWGVIARSNPGNEQVLTYLPKVVEFFNAPNNWTKISAIKAWNNARKANPNHPLIQQSKDRVLAAKKSINSSKIDGMLN